MAPAELPEPFTFFMKKLTCLFLFLSCFMSLTKAQWHDTHWVTSNKGLNSQIIYGNVFNFNSTPPAINNQNTIYEVGACNLTMSDADGNLIFYFNGIKIINSQHDLMENGDSLNWGEFVANHLDDYINAPNLSVSLPAPGNDSLYHIIHARVEYGSSGYVADRLLNSVIDIAENQGIGKVIAKDQFIGAGYRIMELNACRHGNGRDWWVMAQEDTANLYYRSLLTPEGILSFDTQYVGSGPSWLASPDFGGQNLFSPDGKRYVDFDARNGIRVFDFDRCTGLLSNFRSVTFDQPLGWGTGAAISPNSKFLYISTSTEILQFSLNAPDIMASLDTVLVYDGFEPPDPEQYPDFAYMQLMPDGKIYCISNHNTKYVHCINDPDKKGDACYAVQRMLEAPNIFRTSLPTFPNYRLYDLPGSPCDTLGINDPTVGVEESQPEKSQPVLLLTPNPAGGQLHLNTVAAASQPVEVILSDVAGRQVFQIAHPVTVRSFGFHLPELAPGMYVVSVRLRDGQVLVEKLVKE